MLRQSVEFCSFFVYPNGFYGGSLGSRNTLHFYPHGFEIFADQIPLAGAIAERMLAALADGKLVPPRIMTDRYVVYPVPELPQAYLDHTPRPTALPPRPVLIGYGDQDMVDNRAGGQAAIELVRRVYARRGVGGRVSVGVEPGGHEFFPQPIVKFFREHLRRRIRESLADR